MAYRFNHIKNLMLFYGLSTLSACGLIEGRYASDDLAPRETDAPAPAASTTVPLGDRGDRGY